jgi:hypothetical protein
MGDIISLYRDEKKNGMKENISVFLDGGYSPHTLILTANYKVKPADSLNISDVIRSINSKGVMVLTIIKNIVEGSDYLYSIDYGHDHRIIEATGNHKFKTMHGVKRVDCLDIENDFLSSLQENGKFCWVSINSIKLMSPLKMPIMNIYTLDTSSILLEGEIVSYNYSYFRYIRDLWNRDTF